MLARYLRRAIGCIAVFWVIVVFAVWDLSLVSALISILIVPALLAASLALQFVAATLVNRRQHPARATMGQLLHAWSRETVVAALTFLWWLPFRSNLHPDNCPGSNSSAPRRGIVFVHGFVCNRGIWNDWFPELDKQRIPYIAFNLEPVFASIESYEKLLDAAVAQMRAHTHQAPLVICHSMGGLVVRNWLRAQGPDNCVHRVVTLGTPHHGTRIGDGMPQLPAIANAHQMRFNSAWLTDLARHESLSRRAKFVCFYSYCDNIVFPASSATLAGADNRHVAGVAHLALAMDKDVRAQSLDLL
jgi:triacylglycerol lipase